MKKVFSAILALLVMCSFTCFPAFAQTLNIPGVVVDQTNNVKYTATYNTRKKILTYTTPEDSRFVNSDGESEYDGYTASEMILFALAQQSSVSQKTKNAALAYNHYSIWLAMSDIVRSGKVKEIIIKTPKGTNYNGEKLTLIFDYEFTLNKKSQVTKCSYGAYVDNSGMGGSGGDFTLSYDSNGDLKSVYDELAHSPEHTTTFGYSNGKLNKLNVKTDYDKSTTQIVTDGVGRPTQLKGDSSIFYSYDPNGRINSYKIDYGEDINGYHNSEVYSFNYDSAGRWGSADYTDNTDGKTTVTHFTFTYQTL